MRDNKEIKGHAWVKRVLQAICHRTRRRSQVIPKIPF